MANATIKLLVAGLLVVLPVSAGKPKRGQAAQQAAPDVLVLVEGGNLLASAVLLQAEATATRMFARIGLQVQWADRQPGQGAEPAGSGCTPKRPEEIVIRMVSKRRGSVGGEAFAEAHPYASGGVRVTVFYGELSEATHARPRRQPILLAHVLVHEITHVLPRVAQHSATGVMQAHWTTRDYVEMDEGSLEFADGDARLIHLGLRRSQSPACLETASRFSVR
jgi:hypothetical protein